MTKLANDRLDPARTHGDVLLLLQGDRPDVCVHALRRVLKQTRGSLVLRWLQDGFNRPDADPVAGQTEVRNLLGFKDGTANPDASQADLMDDVVWTSAGQSEPAWAAGGSYQSVRLIRMFVEFWDRTALREQQQIIGRNRDSGAPLDAHIRLANPRDGRAPLILRRPFSFARGFDGAGQLDQGLLFVSYQKSLDSFLQTQKRLKGEPLEEYIQPQGGGFFFALPGPGADGWLGQSLLQA